MHPGKLVSRDNVKRRVLYAIKGFTTQGPNAYFGMGSYGQLMREVEKRTGNIRVTEVGNGGISVMYRPKED